MSARALLNRIEAHLLDGLDSDGRDELRLAIDDPDAFAVLAAEREAQEQLEQNEQRRQMLVDIGGEIG